MGVAGARRAGRRPDGSGARIGWRTRSSATTATRRRSRSRSSGPELEFEDERLVAVAGAEFELSAGRRRVPQNARVRRWRPDRGCGSARASAGARAYLAVAGGIAVPPVLGSRATHLVSAMGGLDGRALAAGDRLPLGEAAQRGRVRFAAAPLENRSDACLAARMRTFGVLPGPQRDDLQPRRARRRCSRRRTRSAGNPIAWGFGSRGRGLRTRAAPTSSPTRRRSGALQVPASGQPILLMADRQTTGGYPKIATVIAADIGVAGQLGPGRHDLVRRLHAARGDARR